MNDCFKREWMERALAAETRVKELEARLAGLLPAAQVVVTSIVFLPVEPGMEGVSHTQEGPLQPRTARLGETIIRPEFPVDPADYE